LDAPPADAATDGLNYFRLACHMMRYGLASFFAPAALAGAAIALLFGEACELPMA
jgi:hypothetical protein